MNDTEKLEQAKIVLQEWLDKQGHDRCWYYPEIFSKLVDILEVKATKDPSLPPRKEFEEGCKKYQQEQYEQNL